jgi:hypothetical protein
MTIWDMELLGIREIVRPFSLSPREGEEGSVVWALPTKKNIRKTKGVTSINKRRTLFMAYRIVTRWMMEALVSPNASVAWKKKRYVF